MHWGKVEILTFLNTRGIIYDLVEHEAIFTMEGMEALNLSFTNEVAKNLFLRDKKKREYYLIVMPEDKPANLKELRGLLESKPLEFASAEDLDHYLGLRSGAVSPLGILNNEDANVHVVFDEEIRSYTGIGLHPNDNTASIHMPLEALLDIIREHGNPLSFVHMNRIEN